MITPSDSGRPRHRMISWYSPALLMRTGVRAVIATVVGQISDYREVQAALDPISDDPLRGAYDYGANDPKTGFWFDYVADLGDGWYSTHAVACALATPSLTHNGTKTQRGQVLIMGGDEVYPDPSHQAYKERTVGPYEEACEQVEPFEADLFVLPGNHDWYDGLKAFSGLFCNARRGPNPRAGKKIGAWQTHQRRSYFALRLPHGWWLCAADIQLAGALNATQIDYFTEIAREVMQDGDKIILCAPEPSWVYQKSRSPTEIETLTEIAAMLTQSGREIKLVLAGDLHHYSRYMPRSSGPILLTAGGGGAFKHPTHKLPEYFDITWQNNITTEYGLAATYPAKQTSHRLSYRNLLFPFPGYNWEFAAVIGVLYALLAWFLETRRVNAEETLSQAFLSMIAGHKSVASALFGFFETIPKSPEFAIVVMTVYIGLINLNRTNRRVFGVVLGSAHALAHFAALIVAFCIAVQLTSMVAPNIDSFGAGFLLFLTLMVVVGGILGGLVLGLYLMFSLNVLGVQWTNAFSSLRIADYCNFLRCHISADGRLTIYPFKIDDVPKPFSARTNSPGGGAEAIEEPVEVSD